MSIEKHEATKDYERVNAWIYRDGDGEFMFHCATRVRPDGDEFTCEHCGTTITVQTDDGGVL